MRILGIDPGLRYTGWGVIECDGSRMTHRANGTIKSGDGSLGERLLRISRALSEVLSKFQPQEVAIEQIFVNRDGQATLKLGQARGVALVVVAEAGLDIAEYAPNRVKKTIAGAGHAHKSQIDRMVRWQLPKAVIETEDASDALAIALCHAHHRGTNARYRAILEQSA